MQLKDTFANRTIHDKWESVYRGNKYQDDLNDRIMDRIMRTLQPPPGGLFLDAGCGVGDYTARIARYGMRCVGVDISDTILEDARQRIARDGLEGRVSFQTAGLEQLPFSDDHFDFVHCRGVLMHIPDWERALGELCRVVKPGGKLVILENNLKSLETRLVRLLRRLSRRKSRVVRVAGGLEFWSEQNGNPFVVRIADIEHLERVLPALRMNVIARMAGSFWDINLFPSGLVRSGIIAFNRAWFSLSLPAVWSEGNVIVSAKASPPHNEVNH